MFIWLPCVPANCPPPEAQPAEGVVFRLIASQEPTAGDFSPKRVEAPDADYAGKECMASGLSVYKKRRDLERLMSYPTFRGKALWVAKAQLSPTHGVMLSTPPRHIRNSHHTWWWPRALAPETLFAAEGAL